MVVCWRPLEDTRGETWGGLLRVCNGGWSISEYLVRVAVVLMWRIRSGVEKGMKMERYLVVGELDLGRYRKGYLCIHGSPQPYRER